MKKKQNAQGVENTEVLNPQVAKQFEKEELKKQINFLKEKKKNW